MKTNKQLRLISISAALTITAFVWTFSSCMKIVTSNSFTVSGTVYADCDKHPFTNRTLQLVHYTNTTSCAAEEPKTVTDSKGSFSIRYSNDCGGFSYSNEYQVVIFDGAGSGTVLVTRIPGNEDLDVGALYANNKTKIFLDLQINGTISPEDTLYFGNGYTAPEKIYPVVSQKALYYFSTLPQLYANKNFTTTLYYGIGYNAYTKALSNTTAGNSLFYYDTGCEGLTDTAVIKLP